MTFISTTSNDIDDITKGDFFQMRYNHRWFSPTLMRDEIAIEVD
ncbi:hypothetical protein RE474_09765 [Methanolobus sediminis]|uniref:Uncharacterized protein n=1 Tax=Methanolobus sediminis TaxID=3072978 RepID=A0AA51UL92_9EURY|nr:hypothetical protein [Methanolobus sediminis]WMW24376.1 hypothetical protein RE474_09765 [Methanolobus sediminis]